jgi:energy-converting hydrogenase Eha subunit H
LNMFILSAIFTSFLFTASIIYSLLICTEKTEEKSNMAKTKMSEKFVVVKKEAKVRTSYVT